MTNKELLKKLEILEKEIEKLKIEKQQIIIQQIIPQPSIVPQYPYTEPYRWEITCSSISSILKEKQK